MPHTEFALEREENLSVLVEETDAGGGEPLSRGPGGSVAEAVVLVTLTMVGMSSSRRDSSHSNPARESLSSSSSESSPSSYSRPLLTRPGRPLPLSAWSRDLDTESCDNMPPTLPKSGVMVSHRICWSCDLDAASPDLSPLTPPNSGLTVSHPLSRDCRLGSRDTSSWPRDSVV